MSKQLSFCYFKSLPQAKAWLRSKLLGKDMCVFLYFYFICLSLHAGCPKEKCAFGSLIKLSGSFICITPSEYKSYFLYTHKYCMCVYKYTVYMCKNMWANMQHTCKHAQCCALSFFACESAAELLYNSVPDVLRAEREGRQ